MDDKLLFDFTEFSKRLDKYSKKVKVDSVSVRLPGISISLSPTKQEKLIAKEIILFIRHKRVIDYKECCDTCIKNSLQSLLEIKNFLVMKQMEISDLESPLFLLTDFALFGVNKFLTYTESFDTDFNRKEYFEALNILRGHLIRTFDQIAVVAKLPQDFGFRYDLIQTWDSNLYCLES
jgi:hypothetical protein